MKGLSGLFKAGHVLVIFMFVLCGVALLWLAAQELWHGLVAPAGRTCGGASTPCSSAWAC